MTKRNLALAYASGEPLFRGDGFATFLETFRGNVDADLAVVTHDIPDDVRDDLEADGVRVVPSADVHFLYRDRHLSFYRFLNDHGHRYGHVLVADSRDVLFQADPFDWVAEWKSRYGSITGDHRFLDHFVVLTAEGFKMADSGFACVEHFEFQRDVPMPYMCEDKDRWVINAGVFLGTPRALQDWHFLVWTTTMKTIGRCTDQATVNWLMRHLEDDDAYQVSFPSHDNLCLTGEGVKEGAVRPEVRNGRLYNELGKPYYLVHQWDRLPQEVAASLIGARKPCDTSTSA